MQGITEHVPMRIAHDGRRGVPAPSVGDALDRAVDAAQALVGDHMRLLHLEAATAVASGLHRAAAILSAGALFTFAWVLALATAYAAVVPAVRPLHALAVLTAINLALGLALLRAARARSRSDADG